MQVGKPPKWARATLVYEKAPPYRRADSGQDRLPRPFEPTCRFTPVASPLPCRPVPLRRSAAGVSHQGALPGRCKKCDAKALVRSIGRLRPAEPEPRHSPTPGRTDEDVLSRYANSMRSLRLKVFFSLRCATELYAVVESCPDESDHRSSLHLPPERTRKARFRGQGVTGYRVGLQPAPL